MVVALGVREGVVACRYRSLEKGSNVDGWLREGEGAKNGVTRE
jgi:hypothetical protein